MTSILESSLAGTINSAASFLFLDATIDRDVVAGATDPYDPSTGATSTTRYTCKAIHEEYSIGYRGQNLVQQGEMNVKILAKSVQLNGTAVDFTPLPQDRITIRGQTFTIVPAGTTGLTAVRTDPAKAAWDCRCR